MKISALNLNLFPSLDASILFTSKITICGWREKKCSEMHLTSCFQGTELSKGEQNLFTPNQTHLATLFWKSHGLTTWPEDMPISLAQGTEVLKKLLGTKVFKEQEVREMVAP